MVGQIAITQENDEKDFRFLDTTLQRDELERNLGGGIPKNSILLIEGEDGSGKSILSQRLIFSFLKSEASVTYNV